MKVKCWVKFEHIFKMLSTWKDCITLPKKIDTGEFWSTLPFTLKIKFACNPPSCVPWTRDPHDLLISQWSLTKFKSDYSVIKIF